MDQLKLGKKTVEVAPMTWGTQKKVFKVITRALDGMDKARGLMKQAVHQALNDGQVEIGGIMGWLESVPDVLDEVLTLGLGLEAGDLEQATGMEVAQALEAWAKVNELQAQLAATKNAFSLLGLVAQQGQGAGKE